MYISLPLLSAALSVLLLMWGSGVWIAVRQNRKEREREEEMRLLRQLATVVLGPPDAEGSRDREKGLLGRSEVVASLLLGPKSADGERDEEKGLVATVEDLEVRFREHSVESDAMHREHKAYSRVFAKKLGRVWRAFKWESDDMIAALRAEIVGERDEDPDPLTETGQHAISRQLREHLREQVDGRYSGVERDKKR